MKILAVAWQGARACGVRLRSWATRRRVRRLAWSGLAVAVGVVGLYYVGPLMIPGRDPAPYLRGSASPRLLDRDGAALYAYLNEEDAWRFPRALEGFSPHLVAATIAAEDQRFWSHPGVDPVAVARAFGQNAADRGVVSGASTLTMQLVKLCEPYEPTIPGKAVQAWHALQLERRLDKATILAAYLNRAPYGQNLIGAEAAARRYFGKPAKALTVAEAALLAALPKKPAWYEPLQHPEAARERRNYVLARMAAEGFIAEETALRAREAPLGAGWHDFASLSPHVALRLEERVRTERQVALTLDGAVQREVEELLRAYVKQYDGEVTNAAALVVDVATAEVVARAGSADFHTVPGGQVDMVRAARSPGSLLKPFTYALAMERHVLYPSEMLLDDTLDFGAYNPGNYGGDYNGLVSAREALHYSLNVPALTVLGRTGVPALMALLRDTGVSTLAHEAEHYGLGLTLGNAELRLDELAEAYLTLASLGVHRPLRIERDTEADAGQRLLSVGTCLAVYDMLEAPLPHALRDGLVRPEGVETPVAWKTGTSTGHHDAWAFLFNRHYVVGVWLGNSDGRPSKRLVGADAALPLAAQVFEALPSRSTPAWPDFGRRARQVTVCALSGLPAEHWCPSTRSALTPRRQYLHRRCTVHQGTYAGDLLPPQWPGSAQGWDLAAVPRADVPAAEGDETAAAEAAGSEGSGTAPRETATALRITTPVEAATYVLTGEAQGDRIVLETSRERATVYWYLNDRFLGVSGERVPMVLPLEAGAHRLTCVAADGAQDTVSFEVTRPTSTHTAFSQAS